MPAHHQLHLLYEEWKTLTEEETEAINHSFWSEVDRCQESKMMLKHHIINANENLARELKTMGSGAPEIEESIRRKVDSLIVLEAANAKLLCQKKESVAVQLKELDRSSGNLRQIHKSYATPNRNAYFDSVS
ncbi:MAG: hypothetical protein JWN25_317 [Verrucomicrobiales bacterium]|nr:hypothetical protein [Verrucomicrobiales bacterium]